MRKGSFIILLIAAIGYSLFSFLCYMFSGAYPLGPPWFASSWLLVPFSFIPALIANLYPKKLVKIAGGLVLLIPTIYIPYVFIAEESKNWGYSFLFIVPMLCWYSWACFSKDRKEDELKY